MVTDWSQLIGRTFETIQGAPFTVVNVTKESIIVQPGSSRRRYDISIKDELERTLEAYAQGRFFPKPIDMLYIGVRHERNSYVWGIVYAILVKGDVRLEPTSRSKSLPMLSKVDSSMVYALCYDEVKQTLEAVFWSGQIWRYEGVAIEEYRNLINSHSIGSRMRDIMETHTGYRLRYGR